LKRTSWPFHPNQRNRSGLGRFLLALLCLIIPNLVICAADATNDYSAVDAIFTKRCLECHDTKDPEANLVLIDFQSLMKGGENGPVIVPGKSEESLLVRMIEGRVERQGKKKIMPPGKREKLAPDEIALIRGWIDAGAKPPAENRIVNLVVPKIEPKVPPRRAVHALAYASANRLIAAARYGEVELLSADSHAVVRTLTGHRGNVNAVVFSADGEHLFAAAGEAALFGEVRQWHVADGKLIRVFEGHRDSIYSLAVSPDGATLATGSYDQKIKLWNIADGKESKTLSGHNGAVFDLAFRPDGKILASASADRTVKLWDVATGGRRDTLSQSLKEVNTLAFSPDGSRLVAGGVDNRLRVWEISAAALETSNPLLDSTFAHEGAILKIVYSSDGKTLLSSADDRTVKIWTVPEMKERLLLEKQPDWPPALVLALDNQVVVVGRLDGTIGFYDTTSGKPIPTPKPELTRSEPRGVQRGHAEKIKLHGANLLGLSGIKFHHEKISVRILDDSAAKPGEIWVEVNASPELPRGTYELSVQGPGGESNRLKIYLDDIPQVSEAAKPATNTLVQLPVSFWGALDPAGDIDELQFDAEAGQTIIFDLAAKSLGSKADAVLTLSDAEGKVLASNNDFDGTNDPLLAYKFSNSGVFRVSVKDLMLGGSKEHFYRLSIGEFPFVTGFYPSSSRTNSEAEIELIGYNLPAEHKIKVTPPTKPGEMDLPIDAEKFRSRRAFKLLVGSGPELVEREPNDDPKQATKIEIPGAVCGRIWSTNQTPDVDLFRFEAKAGQKLIIETIAAQRGSPIDTKIEVLHADGKPVPRLLLQAVRNSAVTFRGVDSVTTDCRVENWEEMELNQWLYLQGEVVKLFRAPQGPDSGFLFYSSAGKRRAYFDTSSTAHALDEPCYIVEPHPPGTKLAANGLPVFTLNYANDDDGERKLGSDSRLHFTAPADGAYLVRVTDTRGFSGERFVYRLVVREPKPDFHVTLNGANPTVNRGSGQSFSVTVDRMDEFDGEVRIDISGLPPGFTGSTPLTIQAGQSEAKGTLFAALDAPPLTETNATSSKVVATATVQGQIVKKDVNSLGTIKLGDKPRLFVFLEPDNPNPDAAAQTNDVDKLPELTIAPGQTIPALLKIKRNGHEDLVTFFVENLPHGVIVDNIGLNGVLIPKSENARQIFFNAAKWVPETDRLCYAIEQQAGKQTSAPLLLHVRNPKPKVTAAK
jgi:WD40 repeat protein